MATIPIPPNAVATANPPAPRGGFGPRMVSFTTPTGGLSGDPTGGETLDALMARQKMLQQQAAQPLATSIPSPWQGASQMVGTLGNLLQQRTATTEAAQGRQAIAEAMTHRDPATGELTPDAQATVMRLAPVQGEQLYEKGLDRRAQLEQIQAQQEIWTKDPNDPFTLRSNRGNVKTIGHFATPAEKAAANITSPDPYWIGDQGASPVGPQGQAAMSQQELSSAQHSVESNDYAQKQLLSALGYLKKGIDWGTWSGVKKGLVEIGTAPDAVKQSVDRTDKFNTLFNNPGMLSAMRAGLSDVAPQAVDSFLALMTDPRRSDTERQTAIADMRDKLTAARKAQADRLAFAKTGHVAQVGEDRQAAPDISQIPQEHKDMLLADPSVEKQDFFDKKYGAGAAAAVLGGG
jgi:hypothetical protein